MNMLNPPGESLISSAASASTGMIGILLFLSVRPSFRESLHLSGPVRISVFHHLLGERRHLGFISPIFGGHWVEQTPAQGDESMDSFFCPSSYPFSVAARHRL
jgi:hypothetical protein